MTPKEGVVSWTADGTSEKNHRLTHPDCVPAAATNREEVRLLALPYGLMAFVLDRIGRRIEDRDAFAAIAWALMPFATRRNSGAEMEAVRAATFGAVPGFKPTEIKRPHPHGAPPA